MHRSKQLFIALTLGLGLTVALLTLLALPARAIGFTVTKFTDTNDGVCDADCSLREAIIAANASGTDDTITLGAGTYTLSIAGAFEDFAATGDLDITAVQALTITGLGPDQTFIDAGGIDRVFNILAGTVVVSGVTIQNGDAGTAGGGGILLDGATLELNNAHIINNDDGGFVSDFQFPPDINVVTMTNSVVRNNTAIVGGGIGVSSVQMTINNSDILSNTASNDCGGISTGDLTTLVINNSRINYNTAQNGGGGLCFISSSDPATSFITITNSEISYNTATSGYGGGIRNGYQEFGITRGALLTITNSSLYSNKAAEEGGGIYNISQDIYISNSVIANNQTTGDPFAFANGGGLYLYGGQNTIIATLINSNTSTSSGGGIYDYSELHLENSSLINNHADSDGGGLVAVFGGPILNTTVSGNSAGRNGGGLNTSGAITNSTIANNSAAGYGDGIYGSASLANSIIADNSGSNCSFISVTSLGHNLSSDDSCTLTASGDITNTDPLLEPLANNGGPTVGVDNEPLLTHAMPADSPAVDAANVAACPATDQLGNLRPYGPGCDIGALEVTPKAVLYIRKSAPITVAGGGQVDYVITVTNRGNLTATNVNITDTVPANTNYVSGGAPVGGDVTWSVGDLGPKAVTVQSFAVTTTQAAINIDYIASADGGVTASRNEAIVTIVRQFGVGTSVFVPVQSLGNPPLNSRAVAVGDLNTDGYPDAFVANGSPNTVYLNDGTGRLSDSGQNLADNDSQAVALGDLDDDGDLDAFVGNDGSQGNQIWLNDGDGNFVTTGAPSLGSADSQAVALDDLNGDGLLDVMLGTDAGDGNQIWLNNGEGSLALTETLTVGDSQALALVDFNDDGFPDAVSANNGEDNQIWLNDGDGTFSAGPVLVGTENSQAVVIGDIDNNGHPDVIIGNSGSVANHVWLNQGGGSFNANPIALGNRDTRGLALGDLDLDGDLDLLVANGSDQPNEIWLNDGSGDFGDEPAILFDSSDSNAIALADFDLDGDLDIFVGNGSSGDGQGNTVWLNQDAQQGGVTNNSGGTLVFGGELTLTVNIPAGSLPAQGASFTYTPLLGPTPDFSNTLQYDNRAFELGADTDVTFDPPLTLTVYYPPETEITTDTLRLYYRDTDENPAMWKDVATTCVPTSTYHYEADFVAVAICHLTEFALFDLLSGGSDVFLPVVIK